MNLNRWINLTSSGRVNDNAPITTSILQHTSTIKILRLLELKKGVLEAHIQNDNSFSDPELASVLCPIINYKVQDLGFDRSKIPLSIMPDIAMESSPRELVTYEFCASSRT
ncbi:hypothetical protein WN944_020829 [Citrus x changshan-huyou]|uniref:Uncharacterized protein n=1 Tax=Citrus x changshan-huyou TaxID=2935761 RepID=A0AAP0N0T9_9ROSI